MNTEYWTAGIEECLEHERIAATPDQIARMGKRLAEGASVLTEYSGISERTKPSGAPVKTPEQKQIEKLQNVVDLLARRLGVSIDVDRSEITYLQPFGNGLMGTHREQL